MAEAEAEPAELDVVVALETDSGFFAGPNWELHSSINASSTGYPQRFRVSFMPPQKLSAHDCIPESRADEPITSDPREIIVSTVMTSAGAPVASEITTIGTDADPR